jgi:transcriptional regulator with XRE-family HTH domain
MGESENAASILRSLRREQGRTLRTAAADIGVAPSQLSRIERGQRGLGSDISEKLSNYYGVSAEVIHLSQGEVPADVLRILQSHPEAMDRLRELYPEQAAQ